jgi:hypothetical protein
VSTCAVPVAAGRASASGRVTPELLDPPCRPLGAPCGGPFNVAGSCCGGQLCAMGLPGADPTAMTGVCKPKCGETMFSCEADTDCCDYWGPQVCNPQLHVCLPASMNATDLLARTDDDRRR